jgi:GT2 family glycosyltransferase
MVALRVAIGCLGVAMACASAGVAGYLWLLAVASRLRRRRPLPPVEPRTRFLVVVPAHNEEAGLADCLAGLQALDYPAGLRRLLVVADNCTDATADVAQRCGAEVVTRRDPERVGKGCALAHVLGSVPDSIDAVVVVDADVRPDGGLLRALDARLQAGQDVVQTRYAFAPVEGDPVSYLLSVESLLENDWFYGGKEQLGSPTVLRGAGMCLSRAALRRVPWEAHGLAEDVEYTVRVLRAGIRPHFAGEVSVASDAPSRADQIAVQRRRWTAGHWQVALRQAPRLIAGGLARRDWAIADFGLGLLATSKSTLLAAGVLAGALSWSAAPAGSARALGLCAAGAAIGALAAYGALGVAASRPGRRQALSLLWLLPLAVVRAAAGLTGLISGGRLRWARTPRGESGAEAQP